MNNKNLIPQEKIERTIIIIRGQKVMLDIDLAEMYGVKTKRLNEQVKRNKDRFPSDFMFQLTRKEKQEVVANCDHLEKLKFSRTNPHAFTEHGAIMLANVLHTPTAIKTSVLIVRAFVKLRELLSTHKKLEQKILELESKYNQQFRLIFQVIRDLMQPEQPDEDRSRIGFKIKEND